MSPINSLSEKIITNDAFISDFRLLENNAATKRVLNESREIADVIIERLLLQASVFAFSENIFHKHIAQKILSILHELYPDNNLINYAIQIICARLGNFPVVGKNSTVFDENNLFQKITENTGEDFLIDPEMAAGLLLEEEASRFLIKEKIFHFNIYQNDILSALEEKQLISFSAPTSFGKSFIVRHYIARRYASNNLKHCLIIVPTKSLIDDFFEDFVRIRRDLSLDFSLYTHARSIDRVADKSVFILTQERLSFLINQNPDFVKTFDIVYCDEAHSISRGYRGFVLREVLRKLIKICEEKEHNEPKTKYIFSSPIIKNPDYYRQKLFQHLDNNQVYHKEIKYSPVEKNIHLIEKQNNSFTYYLLHDIPENIPFDNQIEEIGHKNFPESIPNNLEDISKDIHIVLQSNIKNRTIFFNTSPTSAHKYALLLSQQLPDKEIFTDEIRDLGKYIQDHFDKNLGIAELLKKGIGLHYGPMPVGLRRAMVNLFERGILDYLICTPTLLEGVNLPAKNIFLFSDKYGGKTGKEKHSTLSFWNLLGRAGRITFGLSGNVYCIEKNIKKYESLLNNKDVEINNPEDEVNNDNTRRNYLIEALTNPEKNYDYLKSKSRDDIEYLIYELFTKNDPSFLLNGFDPQVKNQIIAAVNQIKSEFEIPIESIMLNPGIDPRLQNKLYLTIKNMSNESLQSYFEMISNSLSINTSNFLSILSITSTNLMWPKISSVSKIASRLTQWIHEFPISGFVGQYLQHFDPPTDIDSQINCIEGALNIIRDLESQFSYSSPKYFKCFLDIAIESANQKGIDTTTYKEKAESFLFTLECGISSVIGRYLYEKGVTRPVAIKANSLVEDLATIPMDDNFFNQSDVSARLRTGMSKIAYEELNDHLNI